MIQWSKGNEQVLKRLCREQEGKHRAVSFRSQTNLAYPRSRLGTIGFGLCSLANESWSPDHGLPLVQIIGATSIERLIAKWKPDESFYFNGHGVRSCRSALALLVNWGHEAGAGAGGAPAAAGSLFCAEAAQRALSTVVARSAGSGRPLVGSCERKPWSPALHGICLLVPRSRSLALSPNSAGEAPAGGPSFTARTSLSQRQHGLARADRLVWPGLLGESSLRIQANVISIVLKDSCHALLLSFLSTFTYILICTIG